MQQLVTQQTEALTSYCSTTANPIKYFPGPVHKEFSITLLAKLILCYFCQFFTSCICFSAVWLFISFTVHTPEDSLNLPIWSLTLITLTLITLIYHQMEVDFTLSSGHHFIHIKEKLAHIGSFIS
jgi:hypothetical protein